MSDEKPEALKNREMVVVREILKRQNSMLGQALLHSDHLLYLQKSISLLSLQEINKLLVDKLPNILSIHYFTVFLYDKNKDELRLACCNHDTIPQDLNLRLEDSPIMQEALTQAKYILEPDFKNSKYFKGKHNPLFQNEFIACIPLMIENEIIGVMNLNDNKKGFISVSELDLILNVAEFISLSLSNALLFEKVEKLSVTDSLTGLFNRQLMQKVLANEFARSKRYGSPLSLVMVDVDHFKKVNDTYGHQKGDEVLKTLADVLKGFCRSHDVPVRYGGEEFLLILPQTPLQGALHIAERIRQTVAKTPFYHNGKKLQVTVSCGLAALDKATMETPERLIGAADQALYKAKETGRNKVVSGGKDVHAGH